MSSLLIDRSCRFICQSSLSKGLVLGMTLLVFTGMSGCDRGPRLVNLKGSVVVDGQPAEGVNLIFFHADSKQPVATGRSESGGSFQPVTDMHQGIPEGKYLVAATWPDPSFKAPKMSMGADAPEPQDLFKGRYVQTKSDIVIDVTSSTTESVIEFKLK